LSIRLPSQLRRRLAAIAARLEHQRRVAGTLDQYFGRYTLSDCCREILAGAVEHYEGTLAAQQPLHRPRTPNPEP
jgi:predicted transcriptional regulator